MSDSGASWNRTSGVVSVDPNEKLFLFGYSCKIFRDAEKATYIDQGKHLIPWMGDKSLMIDRYDVRGYLHDLKMYESKSEEYEDPLAEEEKMCDEERYRSLRSDMSEEQLYQEEELKRLRAAIAGDGAYHEIAFSYDNENEKYVEPEAPKVEEPEDELYQTPEGLTVPKGMEVPYTMKIHAIIEKTAMFVSEQGGQMEIIIKMKQQGNPQFAFMQLDNPLYPYYKHLVKVIKSEAYKPVPVKKVSQSEDEDDDGSYLHPSLMSGRQEPVPKFTVPTINFRRSHDDSYSVLVRNLQQHTKEETASPQPETEQNSNEGSENTSTSDGENNEPKNSSTSSVQIIPPPPDMQPVIDKMAEYVAKNGEDFETIVKSKNDKRFSFLEPGNEYYNYYIHRRNNSKASIQSQSSLSSQNVSNSGTESVLYEYQPPTKPIVQESGPVLYKNGRPADKQPKQSTNQSKPVPATVPAKVEKEIPQPTQESQDAILEHDSKSIEGPKDDTSSSMDFLDSPKIDKSSEEESKSKPCKVLKGPISFSLKSKEADSPSEKAKLTPMLMDDSEDESSGENKTEKDVPKKRRKSPDDTHQPTITKTNSADLEIKAPKQNSEVLEAKQAEERKKDKLLSAARERLAQQRKEKQMLLEQQKREEQLKKEKQQLLDQQRKEKQLQLERKRKAELFLKMLRKKTPDSSAVVSHILGSDKTSGHKPSDFWSLPDPSTIGPASDRGTLFRDNKTRLYAEKSESALKSEWSSDSVSEHSGEEEPISVIGEKLSSEEQEEPEEANVPKPEKKKKKKRKRSRSKSRERSRSKRSKTPRRSKEKRRSRSHSRKQEKKKEKQLPAAYALSARSRSRSRSPRRYRPSFNHWERRR